MRKPTPKRLSQSARTSPVGPAPTIRTCRRSISVRSDFAHPHHDRRVDRGRKLESQVAQPIFRPTGSHARLISRGWSHGRRKTLPAPLRTPGVLPGARGVDQHPIPEAGAELCDVAILHGRAGIDRRAENAREDDDAAFTGVHPVRECPFNLLVVRGIDVLLYHNDVLIAGLRGAVAPERCGDLLGLDRKSTRLNSSHLGISYAVFCLK